MFNTVDLLILNNCPSFYKINLYNELAKRNNIYVVFTAVSDQVVITENNEKQIKFPYTIIQEVQFEKRNKVKCLVKLISIVYHLSYTKIIFGGIDTLEYLLLMFLLATNKNVLQSESSVKESVVTGLKGIIKKIILLRISIVMPSGKLHSDVFKALNYKGKYIETKGVGLFNKGKRIFFKRSITKSNFKYIYVGRLIEKKNVKNLIFEFNENGRYLSIVGAGVLENELKSLAKDNIHFLGFIPNNEIYKVYQEHDVFILPSYSEPWGLVVEEALYWGLPVIVSNAVGCQYEMVLKPNNGLVFELGDADSLINSIQEIETNYELYQMNVSNFDFDIRDKEQVNAYLNILPL